MKRKPPEYWEKYHALARKYLGVPGFVVDHEGWAAELRPLNEAYPWESATTGD